MATSEIGTAPSTASRLGKKEFEDLARFIHERCGIRVGPAKRTMLEGRLQRRLRLLGMDSFERYCKYLFSEEGLANEVVPMIDLVTTNKTDFWREPHHYDVLLRKVLPDLVESAGAGFERPFGLWSAGCSTGEEPYTLGILLSEYAAQHEGFRFGILATDISTRVLEAAVAAIYDPERIEPVPAALRPKYFLRSKDRENPRVRVVPSVRSAVTFRRLNFMDDDYGRIERQHVVFCRNVIIYFDRTTQESILRKIARHVLPGGYVFMGHSETLFGLDVPFEAVAPTVYRRT